MLGFPHCNDLRLILTYLYVCWFCCKLDDLKMHVWNCSIEKHCFSRWYVRGVFVSEVCLWFPIQAYVTILSCSCPWQTISFFQVQEVPYLKTCNLEASPRLYSDTYSPGNFSVKWKLQQQNVLLTNIFLKSSMFSNRRASIIFLKVETQVGL